MGKNKYIESPEKMWEYFVAYKKEVKENPIYVSEQKRGNTILPKDLSSIDSETINQSLNPIIDLPKEKPLTFIGFQNWLDDNDIITDVTDYFENKDNRYDQYIRICSRIKRNIQQDQIEGGMAGIYNPSITQRLNGLVDKSETTVKQEQPLFPE